MSGFLLMISFFTRIPIGNRVEYTEKRYLSGLKYFPFVGLIIGLFLVPFSMLPIDNTLIKGLLITIVYLFISGGIHLDGLADSTDGLFSARDKERILVIMKDSHIGSFGVIALVLYFISMVIISGNLSFMWLLLMPFVGKSFGLIAGSFSDYARKDQGMGYLFMHHLKPLHGLLILAVVACAVGVFLGLVGLLAILFCLLMLFLIQNKCIKTIGGHTGDTIGMTIEVIQVCFLLAGYICSALMGSQTWG